jgi:hypothetical protein
MEWRIDIFGGFIIWFKTFRVEHSGFNKVFNDKSNNSVGFPYSNFKVIPLEMGCCIGIRFHI